MAWKRIARWTYGGPETGENTIPIVNRFSEYVGSGKRWWNTPFVQSWLKLLSNIVSGASSIQFTIRSSSHWVSPSTSDKLAFPNNQNQSQGMNHIILSGGLDKTIGLFEQVWWEKGTGANVGNIYMGFKRGALFCNYNPVAIRESVSQLRYASYVMQDKV